MYVCIVCPIVVAGRAGVRSCVVSYGPETLRADDGGMFALRLVQAKRDGGDATSSSSSELPENELIDSNLALLQVALPNQIRVSQVYENGGEIISGYGYLKIRAPGGYVPVYSVVINVITSNTPMMYIRHSRVLSSSSMETTVADMSAMMMMMMMMMCVMVRRYVVNARVGARRDPFELVGITCRDVKRQTVFYTSLLNAEADVVAGRKGKRENQFRYDARSHSAYHRHATRFVLVKCQFGSNSDAVYVCGHACTYCHPSLHRKSASTSGIGAHHVEHGRCRRQCFSPAPA